MHVEIVPAGLHAPLRPHPGVHAELTRDVLETSHPHQVTRSGGAGLDLNLLVRRDVHAGEPLPELGEKGPRRQQGAERVPVGIRLPVEGPAGERTGGARGQERRAEVHHPHPRVLKPGGERIEPGHRQGGGELRREQIRMEGLLVRGDHDEERGPVRLHGPAVGVERPHPAVQLDGPERDLGPHSLRAAVDAVEEPAVLALGHVRAVAPAQAQRLLETRVPLDELVPPAEARPRVILEVLEPGPDPARGRDPGQRHRRLACARPGPGLVPAETHQGRNAEQGDEGEGQPAVARGGGERTSLGDGEPRAHQNRK